MGCYWAISEEDILAMLRQVADGADPDAVYAEWYANSEWGACPPWDEVGR